MDENPATADPLGYVPLAGRGSLPFLLVHGESLVATATWALEAAEVEILDASVPFEEVRRCGRPVVLHDPLCPLTPFAFIAEVVAESAARGAVVAGVRSVTDTVKELDGDRVGATVDRDGLVCVTSPLVLPATVVAGVEGLDSPDVADFAALVEQLRAQWPVLFLEAPPLGRRIGDEAELRVLEALSAAQS